MPAGGRDDAKEQVRSRVDLVELVRERVPLARSGRQWKGLCPFHAEDTPSFHVTPQTQTWKCFGCDRGGDIFEFVQLAESLDFRSALALLAERAGVELETESVGDRARSAARRRIVDLNAKVAQYYEYVLWALPAGEPGRALLEKREVAEAVARRFGLGYAPPTASSLGSFLRARSLAVADARAAGLVRHDGTDFFRDRLVVPVRDDRGAVSAFVGRDVGGNDVRKYLNSPESPAYSKSRVLFGLDLARDGIGRAGHAVLMEGQFDVIVGHAFGVTNAVASSGTALTEDQVRLLKRFTEEVLLAFDGDGAGRAAAQRAIELLAAQGMRVRVVELGTAKDPDEFLRGGGDWEKAASAAKPEWQWWIASAIADLVPSRPRDLDIAIGRVAAVLDRIPHPAVRERYRVQAAEWLETSPELLVAPPAGPGSRRGRAGTAPPAATNGHSDRDPSRQQSSVGQGSGTASRPGNAPARRQSVGLSVLQLLVSHPAMAGSIRAQIAPEMFSAEGDGSTFARLLVTLDDGGLELLRERLGEYEEHERDMILRAWASPPPQPTDEGIEDLARRLQLETVQREWKSVHRRLAEAEQSGDREQVAKLVTEDKRLAQAVTALKAKRELHG